MVISFNINYPKRALMIISFIVFIILYVIFSGIIDGTIIDLSSDFPPAELKQYIYGKSYINIRRI